MSPLETAIRSAVEAAGSGTAAVEVGGGTQVVVASAYELNEEEETRCVDEAGHYFLVWTMNRGGPEVGMCRAITEDEAEGAGLELFGPYLESGESCVRVVLLPPRSA